MKGLQRSLRRGGAVAPIRRLDVKLNAVQIVNFDGATGVAWSTVVIGDVPEGNVLILGALLNCTLTESNAGVLDTFSGNVSIGSAPTADNTLATNEVDIIPSTAFGPAVSSVATVRAGSTAAIGGVVLDNTDGSLELNLNVLIADASISADDMVLVANGILHLVYTILGDD